MSWEAARVALYARFLALPGIDPDTIHWPNSEFDPSKLPDGSGYWKIDMLFSGVDPINSGGDHERGIFQVSRFVPAGSGLGQVTRDAQTVVDHFKRQVLSGVAINVPTLAPPVTKPGWCHVPTSINFQVL